MCASGSGLRCQAAGNQYIAGVNDTGGVFGELKNQDFQPVWDAVSQQVKDTTTIECEWEIGMPPMGEVLDKNKINVKYTASGMTSELRPRELTGGLRDGAGVVSLRRSEQSDQGGRVSSALHQDSSRRYRDGHRPEDRTGIWLRVEGRRSQVGAGASTIGTRPEGVWQAPGHSCDG